MKNYLDTSKGQIYSTNNYPYGRLKCNAHFGVEYKKNKGFRTTFQTENPKTGRLNAIKNSTYADLIALYKDDDTGHYEYSHFSTNGYEAINRTFAFIKENFNTLNLTYEQQEHIVMTAMRSVVISNAYAFRDLSALDVPVYKTKFIEENMAKMSQLIKKDNVTTAESFDIIFDIAGMKAFELANELK